MSDLYVSKVELEINGQRITDFDSVEEPEFEVYRPVRLMGRNGHTKATERYEGINVEYVIPDDEPTFDFTGVAGGTLTIDRLNGTRIIYGDVYVTKIGRVKYDGDNPGKQTIEFSAGSRSEA